MASGIGRRLLLRIVKMYCRLPKSVQAQVLGKQALRSGTSVAANYREASRARSDAELVSKLGIVEQELDETLLWLELLIESSIVPEARNGSAAQRSRRTLANDSRGHQESKGEAVVPLPPSAFPLQLLFFR